MAGFFFYSVPTSNTVHNSMYTQCIQFLEECIVQVQIFFLKRDSKKVTVGRTTDTQFISFKSLFDKGKRHLKAYAEFDGLFSGSRKAQRVKVQLSC